MADVEQDEHQFITAFVATLKSQPSPNTDVSTYRQEATHSNKSRGEHNHGATDDGVEDHKLIVHYARTLASASHTSVNDDIGGNDLADPPPVKTVQMQYGLPQNMESTTKEVTATNRKGYLTSECGDKVDDEHSTIGQLLTALSSDHSQAPAGDTATDERLTDSRPTDTSELTLAEPEERVSSVLQSEERLAEQRLTVRQLLTTVPVNDPVSPIHLTIDETELCKSIETETSEQQQNIQKNSTKNSETANSVNTEVANDEHLLIAQHSAQLSEPRVAAAQTAAEDTPDARLLSTRLVADGSSAETQQNDPIEPEHQLIGHLATTLNIRDVQQVAALEPLHNTPAITPGLTSEPAGNESIADAQHRRTAQGGQDSDHECIVELTKQLMAQDMSQMAAEDAVDAGQSVTTKSVAILRPRHVDVEHQLIERYAVQLRHEDISPNAEEFAGLLAIARLSTAAVTGDEGASEDVIVRSEVHTLLQSDLKVLEEQQVTKDTVDGITQKVNDSANNDKRLLLEQLQARNRELKEKLARLKEILQARDDIAPLMRASERIAQHIGLQQEKRIDLTTKRDDMMRQLKVRNSLWRSPTISQAGSELSIDTDYDQSSSLTTPIAGGSGHFSFSSQMDDVVDSVTSDDTKADHRRQFQQLHDQLRQMMMKSSLNDDVTTFKSQTTSSSFWSSEKTTTVTAEVTSSLVAIGETTARSSDGCETYDNMVVDSTPSGFATPPNSLDIPPFESVSMQGS